LLAYARRSCSTRCPWAVLLVPPRPLSPLGPQSVLLPAVGLVPRRTSVGMVRASLGMVMRKLPLTSRRSGGVLPPVSRLWIMKRPAGFASIATLNMARASSCHAEAGISVIGAVRSAN
jgi:hypothetical protein